MRIKHLILGFLLSLFVVTAQAGGGHDHGHSHSPVSQQKAQAIAAKQVQRLAEKGKIPGSWKSVVAGKAEQKRFGKQTEWVVVFVNDGIAEASKQRLYVFLSLGGEYLAANYTGE